MCLNKQVPKLFSNSLYPQNNDNIDQKECHVVFKAPSLHE